MKRFKAIAAMSRNRVIGRGGQIPWRIAEDFRWFKKTTLGQVVVMGRKTFESLGNPLPGRKNIVLTHGNPIAGVTTARGLEEIDPAAFEEDVFIIGGGELYAQALPLCSDIFLSVIDREVEGDTWFPEFESAFEFAGVVLRHPEFEVRHYRAYSFIR